MVGHYNLLLVLLSLVLSVLAASVALELSGRMHLKTERRGRLRWLLLGSGAMGIGIWSMHYVGMLALEMEMPVLYDWPTVLLSMGAALAASAVALSLVGRHTLSWRSTLAGGVVMGGAIASMHYIGMEAMRMPMRFRYDRPMVGLSVAAAMLISMAGLRLTFGSKELPDGWSLQKAGSALLIGLAIPTMHYLGMAAAQPAEGAGRFSAADLRHAVSVDTLGLMGVVLVSLLVPAIALLTASIHRRVARFQTLLQGSVQSYTQLKQHHERLQGAFRAGGFGVWECDPETSLFYVDAHLRELYAVPDDGKPVPRETWKASVHPDDVADLEQRWRAALAAGDRYENEYRLLRSSGEIRRVRSIASILRHADGRPRQIFGMSWDVTVDRQREQEIQDQATRFRLTLEAIGDAVIATDEGARVAFLNPAASKLTGWSPEAAAGRPLSEVFQTREDAAGTETASAVALVSGNGSVPSSEDVLLESRTGEQFQIRRHIAPTGHNRAAVITFQDTTAARALERELLHAATHDRLTGLVNRGAFEQRLNQLWDGNRYSGRVHCLCILDLDRFKIINDSSGHIAGDALLREVARLLERHLRPGDLPARMGGDEFMLLLPDITAAAAKPLVEELLVAISQLRFHWQGKVYDLTASLGLVSFDCFSPEPEILLSQADAATFTAKRNGRGQIAVYQNEGSAASHLQEMQMVSDLRRCIEENRFELFAQLIQEAEGPTDARHYEVLLRLRGDDGQLLSPGVFIPAAERFGMMAMVDRWVICHSLKLYAEAGAGERNYRMALNVSAESLSDETLWEYVATQFAETGVCPAKITFELTETGIIQDLDRAKQFIRNAREAGCRIALDDFGTGLSSLGYLKQFPLDVIKIDRAFTRTLLNSTLDQAIIRSIGEIARSVGAETVAEGVEDEPTMRRLQELRVDWLQGWVIGRPVPLRAALAGEAGKQGEPVQQGATLEGLDAPNGRGSDSSGPRFVREWA